LQRKAIFSVSARLADNLHLISGNAGSRGPPGGGIATGFASQTIQELHRIVDLVPYLGQKSRELFPQVQDNSVLVRAQQVWQVIWHVTGHWLQITEQADLDPRIVQFGWHKRAETRVCSGRLDCIFPDPLVERAGGHEVADAPAQLISAAETDEAGDGAKQGFGQVCFPEHWRALLAHNVLERLPGQIEQLAAFRDRESCEW
jgi:hypothetical protein